MVRVPVRVLVWILVRILVRVLAWVWVRVLIRVPPQGPVQACLTYTLYSLSRRRLLSSSPPPPSFKPRSSISESRR